MSKHFGNMKRLHLKLLARYGAEDELVAQVSNELELLKAIESQKTRNLIPRVAVRRNTDLATPQPVSA